MGWLGWPPDATMAADVNTIRLALEGRVELLQMIFGKSDQPSKKGSIAERFKAGARRHNFGYRKSGRRQAHKGG